MKNILLLASIYPVYKEGYVGTKICHYFAKEWVKMGYNVKVLFFWSSFPKPYYWITKPFVSSLRAKTSFAFPTFNFTETEVYTLDGVEVILLPVKKILPHAAPSETYLYKLLKEGVDILNKKGFRPDMITAHFLNPQLRALYLIKKIYPNVNTCLVLHGWQEKRMKSVYGDKYVEYLNSIDLIGFRSTIQQKKFLDSNVANKKTFICYSGVPKEYITKIDRNYTKKINKYVYLGSLYKLKNVDLTIKALYELYPNKDFQFDIIGDGGEKARLIKMCKELHIEEQVIFHGHLDRTAAQEILHNSECFIMVSSPEVLGLVYFEAMAQGLITIGSKGEGIDGLIVDGKNGFLVKPKDLNDLKNKIGKVKSMNSDELNIISQRAMNTAILNTDESAAKRYVEMLLH